MNQPTNHGPVADACKPFDRTVFDIIVAAVDSPIRTESGLRQRTADEKFFGMWGVFEASQVSRWPEHSPLHQGVNFLLCDDGLRFRATPELKGRDEFLEWHPLRSVEHGADKKPLLPFPFDGTDLAIYMVRGPGSFIMSMLTACLEDAGGDLDAAVKLMVPVKPCRCVPDETARLALTEVWRAWRQAAVLIELDPANAADVAACDLARAGEMVAALHSRRASAFEVAALSAPASARAAPNYSVLATREQLINAFGAFTGMDAQWFKNVIDTPGLLKARRHTGRGGWGHIEEPLFCPFEVMLWLVSGKRKKGRPLSVAKGWELFERHFPKAYAGKSAGDPREL